MAVEIPVYVDIKGAFDRAVSDIPKEMPKLESVISKNALKIPIYADGIKTLDELLRSPTVSAKQLKQALHDIEYKFEKVSKAAAGKKNTPAMVNNLAKAYGLVKQRITGVYDEHAVASMRIQHEINRVIYKINEMKASLSKAAVGSDAYNKINYELGIQKQRFSELAAQQMKYKAGIDAGTDSFRKQAGIVKQLTGYFSGLYAAHTLIRFVKQVRDVTGELEYQRVALGHLLQDVEFGNELFNKTIEAAKESPFRIGQLVTYTKQLAAYRIEQENLFDTTQRLADISAGLGVDMDRLILAYGQVRAASVLRGQELRQFTEAGIPLVEMLAEKFRELGREGTTTADVFKLISQRAVPFEYIKEIFEELTDAGGMFYKMQEEQAKTLKGRWEKLKDAYDQALMALGDSSTFQNWNDTVLSILNGLARNLNGIVKVVNAASIAWVAYWVTTKSGISYGARLTAEFIKEYGVINTLRFGVNGLAASFKKLWIAMKANWVGLAIGAISGLITLFTSFKNKTKEVTEEVSDMQLAIEKMKDANKDFSFGTGLVDSYEELAKKTELTVDESERMLDTLIELKKIYPELSDKIDENNMTLEDRIKVMRDVVSASHDMAVEEAKTQLKIQDEIIRGLEEEAAAAKLAKDAAVRALEQAEYAEKAGPVMGMTDMGESYVEKSAEQLKEETIAAAAAAKTASDNYDKVAEKLAKAKNEAKDLRKIAFPEQSVNQMAEWQKLLANARKYTSEGVTKEIFSEADVKNWDSLGEAIKKLKPQFKEAKETYEGLVSAVIKGGELVRPELTKDRDSAKDAFDAWEVLDKLLGGLLSSDNNSGSGYHADPFIAMMQERMKFMQDFKKGYEDLNKYVGSSDALAKISEKMASRGLSLGIDESQQKRAASELSQWYAEAMDEAFKEAKKHGAAGRNIQEFLSKAISDNTNRGKAQKDFQKLIQSLFDAKTDLDTSVLKKRFDDALKRLKDEIKHSETAKGFMDDIFELTGNKQLATQLAISVYGTPGDDLEKNIQELLAKSFVIDESKLPKEFDMPDISEAIKNKDVVTLRRMLQYVVDDNKQAAGDILANWEKEESEWLKGLYKTYEKAKTFQERKDLIKDRATATRNRINSDKSLSSDEKTSMLKAVDKQEARDIADVEAEALKTTYEWVSAFKDMERVSNATLKELIRLLDEYIEKNKETASPEALKTLMQSREQAQAQLIERNGYAGLIKSAGKYLAAQKKLNALKKAGKKGTLEYRKALDEEREALIDMQKSVKAVGESFESISSMVSSVSELLDLDELSDGRAVLEGIATGLSLVGTALVFINAMFELLKTNPIVLALSAIIAGIAALASILGNLNVAKANREIEKQNKLLHELEYNYDRLGKAIEEAFGSEYIYNYTKQLEILSAKQAAYTAQANAERSKGKKADLDKIQDYEDSARDAADQIGDMKHQLSEFFSGTDLTSAAEDFAEAWIDAYKEFGSTTDAMSEKFNDMIESMIQRSLAAKIMQEMLKPVFDQIDELAKDGVLSMSEIAQISQLAQQQIPLMNEAMTGLMTGLAAAGQDVRASTAGFHGISKEIAGASEEAILGLAAGINTQNFYMSYMPRIDEKVSAILSAMTGGSVDVGTAPETGENGEVLPSVQKMVYDHLPLMDQNLAELLRLVKSVITTKNGSTNTNYVAVK